MRCDRWSLLKSVDLAGKGRNLYRKADVGRELIILSGQESVDSARNAGKIAEFMGISHFNILQAKESPSRVIDDNLSGRKRACIIVGTNTFGKVFDTKQDREKLKETISREEQVLFLYGIEDLQADGELVKQLTDNSIVVGRKWESGRVKCAINSEARNICQQLSSLVFEVEVDPNINTFLVENNSRKGEILCTLNGEPFFIGVAVGGAVVFLSGCRQIADVDEYVREGKSLLSYFTSLIPLMMVLRYVYPTRSWHNSMKQACFIIDDPPLKKAYGFLDYEEILKVTAEERFCTSIGFIPWNYRRTNRDVALLFQEHSDKFSISVHGCDHTRGELGWGEETLLRSKAAKGLERMTIHQQLWGIPFDKVMVFPQGIFSIFAMKALKSCGYLAAANSTPYPVDLEDNRLTLRELIDVAVTRFSNLPLFIRRYPKNFAELALDLFLGKPALIVEHHAFFRNGYGVLRDLVNKVNSLERRLEWKRLEEICSHANLKRVDENGEIHVKFYADRFGLQNETDRPQNYILFRRRIPEQSVMGVTINNRYTDFGQEADWLKIPVALDASESAEIKIKCDEPRSVTTTSKPVSSHNVKVFVRRVLSEFRDNYVETNQFTAKAVSSVKRLCVRKKEGVEGSPTDDGTMAGRPRKAG